MPKVILYQPRIHNEHIKRLYVIAKKFDMSMTKLVNLIVAVAIEELEQVDDPAEWEVVIPIRREQE